MREVTAHKLDLPSDLLKIEVSTEADDADVGKDGTHHVYHISAFRNNEWGSLLRIPFQKGPPYQHPWMDPKIIQAQVNGITVESLLAIALDFLKSFQGETPKTTGQFKCRENAIVITKLEESLHWLHARTRDRLARQVEGEAKV
jgi:hypothetical protein